MPVKISELTLFHLRHQALVGSSALRAIGGATDQHSENSRSQKASKAPRIEDIEKIIQKQVEKASHLLQKEMEPWG